MSDAPTPALDLVVDLNSEDEPGLRWTFLHGIVRAVAQTERPRALRNQTGPSSNGAGCCRRRSPPRWGLVPRQGRPTAGR